MKITIKDAIEIIRDKRACSGCSGCSACTANSDVFSCGEMEDKARDFIQEWLDGGSEETTLNPPETMFYEDAIEVLYHHDKKCVDYDTCQDCPLGCGHELRMKFGDIDCGDLADEAKDVILNELS